MSRVVIGQQRSGLTLGVTLLIAGTVFFGFGFTIVPDVILRLRPAVLYIHVASAAAWMVLLVTQAALARNRQIGLHRKIGAYGLWVGGVAAASAFATALVLRHDSVVQHGADRFTQRVAFLSIPLSNFVIFSIALALAALLRARPAYHRRLMILGSAALMTPALARIPVMNDVPHFTDGVPDLLLLALCAHEYWRERRVHPVYWVGLPAIIAVQQGAGYLFTSHPAWWVTTARFLIGV